MRSALVLAFWAAAGGSCLAAQQDPAPPAEITVSVGAEHVSSGEGVPVVVRYAWQEPWHPRDRPSPAVDFSNEEVASFSAGVESVSAGAHTLSYALVVKPPRTGAWLLPEVRMLVLDDAGGQRLITAPAAVAMVGDIDPDQRPAPRALVHPHPPDPGRRWAAALALLAGGCVLVACRWLQVHRWRAPAPPPTAWERLQAALDLAAQDRDGKAAAAAAALALRTYAGSLWDFDGAGATAQEAAARVARLATMEESLLFAQLLAEIEQLRWAPSGLHAELLAPLLRAGRQLGLQVSTRLQSEAERAGTAASEPPARAAV